MVRDGRIAWALRIQMKLSRMWNIRVNVKVPLDQEVPVLLKDVHELFHHSQLTEAQTSVQASGVEYVSNHEMCGQYSSCVRIVECVDNTSVAQVRDTLINEYLQEQSPLPSLVIGSVAVRNACANLETCVKLLLSCRRRKRSPQQNRPGSQMQPESNARNIMRCVVPNRLDTAVGNTDTINYNVELNKHLDPSTGKKAKVVSKAYITAKPITTNSSAKHLDHRFFLMTKSDLYRPKERGGKVFVSPDSNQPMEHQVAIVTMSWDYRVYDIAYGLAQKIKNKLNVKSPRVKTKEKKAE
ncbi:hypothetical protein Tco_1095363 [Tanacetum coccineum]